jgi:hypothetical protein
MNALARLFGGVTARVWTSKPASEPEPLAGRTMTGFFANLTPEQKQKALAYRGPENHGSSETRKG